MNGLITKVEQATASISNGIGGYFDFLMLHFGAYVTPRSFGEFVLFCIAAVVVAQILQLKQQLSRLRHLPHEVRFEIHRLQDHTLRLSRTLAVLRTDQTSTPNGSD